MNRDSVKLKELIFSKLDNDATLKGLLGGNNKVRHANPLQISEYPCVVYYVIMDTDNPYNADVPTGIVTTRLGISVFTTGTSSKLADQIDDRVYALLEGKILSNSDYLVYTCYRKSTLPLFEPDHSVWRTESRYDLVNVLKA
jgi:hypothetical protein